MIGWDSRHSSEIAALRDRAARDDSWAVERLLSRPTLSSEATVYWSAFVTLSRDRPHESISMGMGGGLSLPRPVPRETIRREGRRLYYTGDDLADFVEIIARIDDLYVEVETKRIAEEAKASAKRTQKR